MTACVWLVVLGRYSTVSVCVCVECLNRRENLNSNQKSCTERKRFRATLKTINYIYTMNIKGVAFFYIDGFLHARIFTGFLLARDCVLRKTRLLLSKLNSTLALIKQNDICEFFFCSTQLKTSRAHLQAMKQEIRKDCRDKSFNILPLFKKLCVHRTGRNNKK